MNSVLLLVPVLLAIVGGLASYFLPLDNRGRRIFIMSVVCVTSVFTALLLFFCDGQTAVLMHFTDTLTFSLRLDGAGRIFAGLVAFLWPLTTLYAFSYMEHEKSPAMFYAFFTTTYGVTLGIAFASNMLTMYLFYELLTLCTIPLILQPGTGEARRAARMYMVFSFGGAAFAFIGFAFLASLGSTEFVLGGVLGAYDRAGLARLIWCFAFVGFGVKAAIFPLHGWLPVASVAPTPVTALLHAVAVVKAGAFAVIRLTYYAYGTDLLYHSWAQGFAMTLTIVTIIFGSAMALKQYHFKRRLAYSTVANLSYILFAATLMTPAGMLEAFLHLVFHSLIKIVVFFAAGAVLHRTGRAYIDQLGGLGARMPVTFTCFTVASLSLIGIPPFNGFFSKWAIAEAAVETGLIPALVGVGALLISAFLTTIYTMRICLPAWLPASVTPLSAHDAGTLAPLEKVREADWRMCVPMVLLAVLCILTGFFSHEINQLFARLLF